MRRRAAAAAAVLQLVLLAGIGGVLIVAGVVQATTPAPAAQILPMRPATDAERQQWDVDQMTDLLRAQQESGHPASGQAVPHRCPLRSRFVHLFKSAALTSDTWSHHGNIRLAKATCE